MSVLTAILSSTSFALSANRGFAQMGNIATTEAFLICVCNADLINETLSHALSFQSIQRVPQGEDPNE